MLEDISNPFNQVVNRPPRPSHANGRSPHDAAAARRVVPIPAPAVDADSSEGKDGPAPATGAAMPITTAPGPSEVNSPSWWSRKPSTQS